LWVSLWGRDWFMPTAPSGKVKLNPGHKSAWKREEGCIWRAAGVWRKPTDSDAERPILLKPDYFCKYPDGRPVNFGQDFLYPFLTQFSEAIHTISSSFIVFLQVVPGQLPPKLSESQRWRLGQIAYAPHWYDLKMVFEKSFNSNMTVDVQALRRVSPNKIVKYISMIILSRLELIL
jgi:hypothetical protein